MKRDLSDIFNLDDEQRQPVRGSLLIAKPTVADDFFHRSVVLLIDHDSESTMGVIVNKYSELSLADAVPDMANGHTYPLLVGGPVNLSMMFMLHTLGAKVVPDAVPLGRGLYFGGDYDTVRRLVENGEPIADKVKFIMGYSGWEPGQLDDEIARHDWAVLRDYNPAMVMAHAEEQMWHDAVSLFGDRYTSWNLWPADPSMN